MLVFPIQFLLVSEQKLYTTPYTSHNCLLEYFEGTGW